MSLAGSVEYYRVERKGAFSDAYRFGLADYLGRPSSIGRGDYILVARPEADFDTDLLERAVKDGIGLGKIGAFMSTLNRRDISAVRATAKAR